VGGAVEEEEEGAEEDGRAGRDFVAGGFCVFAEDDPEVKTVDVGVSMRELL
jgi:hypothetical protein